MMNALRIAALIAALAAPSTGSAQTPMLTLPYDQLTQVIETHVNTLLEQDGRLHWASGIHIEAGPGASGEAVRLSHLLKLRLMLQGDQNELGSASDLVDVSVYLATNCDRGEIKTDVYAVTWDTGLPQWVQDLVLGDASISHAALQDVVSMVKDGMRELPSCGDVRVWEEGMVMFPPDTLDALTSGPQYSTCTDSTSGRTGRVSVQDGMIVAQLMPGTTERWPGSIARLNVWISPDADEAHAQLLQLTQDQPMVDGGPGLEAMFGMPENIGYVGCDISW